MARILLGWELGANTGHTVKLAGIADALAARGHEVAIAAQQIGPLPPAHEIWQAPLWPALISTSSRSGGLSPATMGDILANVGLQDSAALHAVLSAWDGILAAVRPDAVAAEFAPGLLMAARGRVPVLAVGSGFSHPPAHLPVFASLTGQPAVRSEAMLLERANAALRAAGRPLLDRLTEIFAADRELIAAFREFDPYREWRQSVHGAPSTSPVPSIADGGGDELFVYVNSHVPWPNAFWQGLADSRLKVRVYDPRLNDADRCVLEAAGMVVEPDVVPFAAIVRRSRLLLSHGGLGLISSALLAGLPVVAVPFDIEKKMNAASLERIGLGVRLDHDRLEASAFSAMIRAAWEDDALHRRAREAAVGFRLRMDRTCEEQTAEVLDEMIR